MEREETEKKNFTKSPRKKVRWPKLKLTAFGKSSDGQSGFAKINGQYVLPGGLIGGKVRLVEIRPHDVVVEYQGETRSLTIDPDS